MRFAAVSLAAIVALSASVAACTTGCTTALAEGTLVVEGGTLVMQPVPGVTMRLRWPSGYQVREQDGGLALVDWFGTVKGRAGDVVGVAGGVGADDVFQGCGDVFPAVR